MRVIPFILLLFGWTFSIAQITYFPERGKWEEKTAASQNINSNRLQESIKFATSNEYPGSKALIPSSTNSNYGYMWWLNKEGNRQWKNLPEDLFYASGFGGNFIVIDRNQNLVIVTRWLEPSQIETFLTKVYSAL